MTFLAKLVSRLRKKSINLWWTPKLLFLKLLSRSRMESNLITSVRRQIENIIPCLSVTLWQPISETPDRRIWGAHLQKAHRSRTKCPLPFASVGGGGGLQNRERWAEKGCPNCIPYCLDLQICKKSQPGSLGMCQGWLIPENHSVGTSGVCRMNRTQKRQLLLVVN